MSSVKKLVLASHNKGKLEELKALLEPYGIDVISALELGLDEPEETGETFTENAVLKAEYVFEKTGIPSLADDSGLVVPSLGDFPGVRSARYAKSFENLKMCYQDLHQRLQNRPREAYFECVLSFYHGKDQHHEFRGRLEGKIVYPARGEDGFCFDFVFQPKGKNQTLAELGRDVKNKISHRSIALKKFIDSCLAHK